MVAEGRRVNAELDGDILAVLIGEDCVALHGPSRNGASP